MSLPQVIGFLTSPALPAQILAVSGAIATVIVVSGIAIWGILGAFKVFLYLIGVNN